MCLLMQNQTDITFGNKQQYPELSFSVGFFAKVSKNKELKYLLPFIISPTQVPVSYYMKEVLHLRQKFNYHAAARIVIYSQVAILPVIS